jgi:hypothetical protein
LPSGARMLAISSHQAANFAACLVAVACVFHPLWRWRAPCPPDRDRGADRADTSGPTHGPGRESLRCPDRAAKRRVLHARRSNGEGAPSATRHRRSGGATSRADRLMSKRNLSLG